jgi:RNA polymerase sigma factor (sigma-70 family)
MAGSACSAMVFAPRQSLVASFSTFLRFEHDRAVGWLDDRRLKRSIQQLLTAPDAPTSEAFWVNYWQAIWQAQHAAEAAARSPQSDAQHRLALGHLTAYLQETCFWSVQRIIVRLDSVQYSIVDGFQIAIAQLPKLLQAFDPNRPGSFKAYANTAFANLVRSHLRNRREIDLCSTWGLLLKLSRKQIQEALANAGFAEGEATAYRLLWQCLRQHYHPAQLQSQRQLTAPPPAILERIAVDYGQAGREASVPPEALTATQITQRLQLLAQHARAYLYPQLRSLNVTQGDSEDDWLSNLPDPAMDSPMAHLVAEETGLERQDRQAQLNQVLGQAIADLEPTMQALLKLYYQEQATQQAIAKQLQTQQYTVSRKLTKARQQLLLTVAQWSQTELHISLNSDVIASISTALEDWLQMYYAKSVREHSA